VGRGDIRAALLRLLAEQPMHGYQLMQRIAERSGGIWQPNPGSVYPTLQALEDEGLVRAEPQEGRRVFQLTDAGRAYVEAHQGELAAAWEAVVGTVDEGVLALHERLRQLGAAVAQLADAGTAAQVVEAQQLLDRARRQLYRILAQDEPAAEAPDAGEAGPH
jgi:DNA-binding PadR family transcriptional regulator